MDWIYCKPLDMATFWSYAVDIHHIFPKAWCEKNGIDTQRRESIVNKTALSRTTNQKIGGKSPEQYVTIVEKTAGSTTAEFDELLRSHYIDPSLLRAADFSAFFVARTDQLLALIGEAMGKSPVRTQDAPTVDRPEDFELESDEPEEEPDVATPITTAAASFQPSSSSETAPALATAGQRAAEAAVGSDARHAKEFDRAMRGVYDRARNEAGYNATYFLGMLADYGGLETARRLLRAPAVSEGFAALWERQRLDLTVEALVLRDEFAGLFSDDELEAAQRRLAEFGFSS